MPAAVPFRRDEQRGFTLVELLAAVAITLFVMAGVYGLMIQNQQIYEKQTQLADIQQNARVALDMMTREIRMAGADPSGKAFAVPTCRTGTYKPPTNPTLLTLPGDIAPLTVAEPNKIRVKLDRGIFALGLESNSTAATPMPTPAPVIDFDADNDYADDDENRLGDSFINDPNEDVEYRLDGGRIIRKEYRDDPEAGCRPGPAPPALPGEQRIAENVVALEFQYYATDAPNPTTIPAANYPCPEMKAYDSEDAYETARNLCDLPLPPGFTDLSAVRRVRIRLVVQTERADPRQPKISPNRGKARMTMVSEVSLRNRN